jgi:hypothetical protein
MLFGTNNDNFHLTMNQEEDLLDICMYNGYLVLTNKVTLKDLIDNDDDFIPFPFVPGKEVPEESIQCVIDYYCDKEEYEICQEIINNTQYETKSIKI